ncbi:MAG: Uma2 family endonuclease [Bryobacterales bacterium]|nr:Uma2 family endonuclease [Bryobacterales bacterium]
MPATATITKRLPSAATGAPEAALPEHGEVEYPEGRWIAQSVWHGDAVSRAKVALDSHFRGRKDVLVAMELVVYYQRGNNRARLQPDLQVVFGVGRGGDRSSFRVWEDGKAPDFVLEVASPSTAENDARHKATEYAGIGVREYWRLDPGGSLMGTPLEGYSASGGRYGPVEAVEPEGRGVWLRSKVLGLDLRGPRQDGATVVAFRDPDTGREFTGELTEAERRMRIAEKRASAAEERASAADKRAQAEAGLRRAAEKRAQDEADLRRAAEERMRAMEKRLRNATARATRPGRES